MENGDKIKTSTHWIRLPGDDPKRGHLLKQNTGLDVN